MSAKNIILQPAPTNGSWSATSKVSIDGTDDYLQAGIVAYTSSNAWAKLVVMRRGTAELVLDLGARTAELRP